MLALHGAQTPGALRGQGQTLRRLPRRGFSGSEGDSVIAFLGGSYDPGQWLALGAILGFILGIAAARWWYRPVDLRRFYPPGWAPREEPERGPKER